MANLRNDLLQGTLDLLILQILSHATLHGWDIAKRMAVLSQDRLTLKQGSLYPALHRLEAKGWIAPEWGVSEAGRSAKFYKLTRTGRRQLEAERANWDAFVVAMASVLKAEKDA
ncbi:PadR family transcriptional regulator [Synoicihabitans lomoniglobus]|uniref:PadR family transcriptional regulator n=1 Tax=Synoicihabitans lomoniglobus TaxID=2909285 RepID=A0AAE9ZTH8_9BACT|nr:PadR family transcriptional regulator [Opitutaceae bacterium LMO-M01]WED63822.1 PadR family transcriptional regulator [Opitutaceae bacterium LMO-M01]